MVSTNNLNVTEMEKYLNKIFDLSAQVLLKDYKIKILETQVALAKSMIVCFEKHYLQHGVKEC